MPRSNLRGMSWLVFCRKGRGICAHRAYPFGIHKIFTRRGGCSLLSDSFFLSPIKKLPIMMHSIQQFKFFTFHKTVNFRQITWNPAKPFNIWASTTRAILCYSSNIAASIAIIKRKINPNIIAVILTGILNNFFHSLNISLIKILDLKIAFWRAKMKTAKPM